MHPKKIGYFVFLICIGLILMSSDDRLPKQKGKILNIASYHAENEWTQECIRGIEERLRSAGYVPDHFYMDTKRIPPETFDEAAEAAWRYYLRTKPDLVMLGDDNAFRLLATRFARIPSDRPRTPVVHYGVNNNPRYYFADRRIPDNITGVLERPLIVPWVRYIKKIMPEIRNVLVIFDKSASSEAVIAMAFYNEKRMDVDGAAVHLMVSDAWKVWEEAVSNKDGAYDAIIIVNHFTVKDETGKNIEHQEIIRRCAALSPVPIFATNEFTVHDSGAVGAMVVVGRKHGAEAAEMALKILHGQSAASLIHNTQTAGSFIFNKAGLNRFHLTLPEEIASQTLYQ